MQGENVLHKEGKYLIEIFHSLINQLTGITIQLINQPLQFFTVLAKIKSFSFFFGRYT